MKIREDLIQIEKKYNEDEMREFKNAFSNFTDDLIDKLYFSSIGPVDSLIYYDVDKNIIFETQIYKTLEGFKMIVPSNCSLSPLDVIELKKEEFQKQLKDGNIDYLAECMVPASMSTEFIALVNRKG